MKCMEPVKIYWDRDEQKYSFKKPDHIDWDKCIVTSCGRCPACRQEWRTHLARRVMYELENYSYNERCFLTLTCDDRHINEVFPNMSLDHEYFKKFIKRLRRYLEYHKIPHKPIKYLVSGEYGTHNTHRPHFHLILFGWKPDDLKYKGRSKKGFPVYKSELILKLWRAGYIEVGDVTEQTAGYMVKYIVKYSENKKSITRDKVMTEDVINEYTGEITEYKWTEKVRERVFKAPVFVGWTKDGGYRYEERVVKPPYIVYPKKIMGIDFFLKNFRQILGNGFIMDSRGHRHSIPKNFLKYCKEHEEDIELNECYQQYLAKLELIFEEEKQYLISLGYKTFNQRYQYYQEQGRIKRIELESFRNKNR